MRRHRGGLAAAFAFVALLVAGVVTSTVLAVQAGEAKRQAEGDRDKALTAENQAKASAEEARSVLVFFEERLLAAGRPEGQEGGALETRRQRRQRPRRGVARAEAVLSRALRRPRRRATYP